MKVRLIAAIKLFLWMCLFDIFLGPASYYGLKNQGGGKPFGLGVIGYTVVIIFLSYAFILASTYLTQQNA